MKKTLFTSLFLFSIGMAAAQVSFNEVTYRGSGCPRGSVSSAVSPDGSTISILFDELRAEVPDSQNRRPPGRGRAQILSTVKNCSLSFTANLPIGTTADNVEVSLQARGSTLMDAGVKGYFNSFIVGIGGMVRSRNNAIQVIQKNWNAFPYEIQDDWTEMPQSVVPLYAGCANSQSRSIRFDMVNQLQAEIPSGDTSKYGLITVDSADATGMLKFTLRTRPCSGAR